MKKHKIKFYTRFGQDIRDGVKTCTIRKDKPGRILPEVGQPLELVDSETGESYNPVAKNPICAGVWPVEITIPLGYLSIKTDFFIDVMGGKLNYISCCKEVFFKHNSRQDTFSKMHGFHSVSEMYDFYDNLCPLKGHLISWGKK